MLREVSLKQQFAFWAALVTTTSVGDGDNPRGVQARRD
jgi:hypothetical protein